MALVTPRLDASATIGPPAGLLPFEYPKSEESSQNFAS